MVPGGGFEPPTRGFSSFGRRHGSRASPEFRHVYFIEAVGLGVVKIGCADDARKRLAQLQVGCPDDLVLRGVFHTDDAPRLEAAYHERYAHLRIRGEWFRFDEDLRDLADSAFDPDGDVRIPICFRRGSPGPGSGAVEIHWQDGDTPETFSERVVRIGQALGLRWELDAAA
jgi:hypothetical protein